GRSARRTGTAIACPSRTTSSRTCAPGAIDDTRRISSSLVVTEVPSIAVIRSYGISPALAPGVFSVTSYTSAPRAVPRLSDSCSQSSAHVLHCDLNYPAATPPAPLQLRHHGAGLVHRAGEADVARARADRRFDADHLAAVIDERPAAVAEVDRRVGLDVVVE